MTDSPAAPIRVNCAPVLTLWAAPVAGRLGHLPDTALSLASAVAGTTARAKARRLGIAEDRDRAKKVVPMKPQGTARLLGRDVKLTHYADGVVLAMLATVNPPLPRARGGLHPQSIRATPG